MRIFNGKVFGADHKMHDKDLCFENGIITASSESGEFDASGCYVLPGLIDTHIHGARGLSFMSADLDLSPALDWLCSQGVTSIMVTTACQSPEALKKVCESIKNINDSRILGIHAEGPFVNPVRKGGMTAEAIQTPNENLPEMMYEASGGLLKIMTLAPEIEGAEEAIKKCVDLGILVSIGHSDATYEQAKKAVEAGASRLTHTFNAIRPYNHREPGALGYALDDEKVHCELICDLYHVSAPAVRLVLKLKGHENVTMISDSLFFCGMGDGEYVRGGKTMYVKDGLCTLQDGTINGSTRCLFDGAKNMFELGCTPEQIAVMASVNPAKAAGSTDRGELIEGYKADILIVDSEFNIKAVFTEGKRVR